MARGPGLPARAVPAQARRLTRAVELVLDRRDKSAPIEQARILMTEVDGIANDRFRLFYRSYLS